MQNTLDITLPQEASYIEQVQELIKSPPKVTYCGHCENEFYGKLEKEFIADFGMCLGCEKNMCDTTVYMEL